LGGGALGRWGFIRGDGYLPLRCSQHSTATGNTKQTLHALHLSMVVQRVNNPEERFVAKLNYLHLNTYSPWTD
jgi:hypothetical protein